jgi:hypothetical protein
MRIWIHQFVRTEDPADRGQKPCADEDGNYARPKATAAPRPRLALAVVRVVGKRRDCRSHVIYYPICQVHLSRQPIGGREIFGSLRACRLCRGEMAERFFIQNGNHDRIFARMAEPAAMTPADDLLTFRASRMEPRAMGRCRCNP